MYQPRVGDWDCKICGRTKIFARRDVCQGCGAQKPMDEKVRIETKSFVVSSPDNLSERRMEKVIKEIKKYRESLALNSSTSSISSVSSMCSLCTAEYSSKKCPCDSWKYDCDFQVCTDCANKYRACGSCIQSTSRHTSGARRVLYCLDHNIH